MVVRSYGMSSERSGLRGLKGSVEGFDDGCIVEVGLLDDEGLCVGAWDWALVGVGENESGSCTAVVVFVLVLVPVVLVLVLVSVVLVLVLVSVVLVLVLVEEHKLHVTGQFSITSGIVHLHFAPLSPAQPHRFGLSIQSTEGGIGNLCALSWHGDGDGGGDGGDDCARATGIISIGVHWRMKKGTRTEIVVIFVTVVAVFIIVAVFVNK